MKDTRITLPITVLLAFVIVPAAARAAEISYLPETDRAEAVELGLEPSLALLTWELPGGLLAVDRLDAGVSVAGARPIQPVYRSGEWFLVDARARRLGAVPAERTLARLQAFGAVHRLGGGFALCETPVERLADFLAAPFDRQRVPIEPPPVGWDRYGERVSVAMQRGTTRANPDDVASFVALYDDAAFRQVLQEISGAVAFTHDGSQHVVQTRYYDTAEKNLVADYLLATLAGYGYTVELDDFVYNGTPCRNVVATRLGTTSPEEYVVLGAHYDSMSEQPATSAPGAEDNGSGTSLVMEVARMAAGVEFDRSVQFVLFDAEEVGLVGSEHFVSEAVADERTIASAINADMVTFYDDDYGVKIEGEPAWESLMSVMEDAVAEYTALASYKDYSSWGSDHVPFQQAGIPAFLAIDWDWSAYPHYHTSNDSWANVASTAHIGGEITRACAATLAEVAGLRSSSALRVTPFGPFEAEGQPGGPFVPASVDYTVENAGDGTIDYTVSATRSWVNVSTTGGNLAPGATARVTVSFEPAVGSLPEGVHTDAVSFVNATDHDGDTARVVSLRVGQPVLQHEWTMDVDPGWNPEGLWAWGVPAGGGGEYGHPDPTSGATGATVYGYNLAGDYENGLPETHLTTAAIDCTGLSEVSVQFERHLNVEQPAYDHAYVRVSRDGADWTTVWQNGAELTDAAWTTVEYDISDVADGQPTVYLRWTQGTTDGGWQYSGWNIDDVRIHAFGCPGCAPPPIPDGSAGTSPLRASRLDAAGTRIELDWDDRCAPATTKLVHGPLDEVSSWTFSGAVCSIDASQAWDPVPAGDLWFLLVAGNAAGAESSWGQATAGERSGLTASGMCGSTAKDLSATCP